MKEWFIKWYGIDLGYNKKGLGPNSFSWWRILLPYSKLFYQARVGHDIGYTRGTTNQDKRRTDEMFYKMMKRVCKNNLQKCFRGLYYFLVKSYGYLFFNRGKTPRYNT